MKNMKPYYIRASRWGLIVPAFFGILFYSLLSAGLIIFTWPIILTPVENLSLFAILLALITLAYQLSKSIWEARGADWQITFIRQRVRTLASNHSEACFEFIVQNIGSKHGILITIEAELPKTKKLAAWNPENSIHRYLNSLEEKSVKSYSLALPAKSAHTIFVCYSIVGLEIEYAIGQQWGNRLSLEELKGHKFRFKFIFTKAAYHWLSETTTLRTKEFTFNDMLVDFIES